MLNRLAVLAVTALALLPAAALAGPPRVDLGTAGAYAVLGGSGMTNTGVSTITGDVGSSPTHSQTGFAPCPAANCVNLTGANHDVADPNDAVTQQAKTDLITAYDDAFGRTGGTAVSAPLGAGMTLVSGVYTSATDIFVGGDLTLDAGGDPSSVFIFQARTGTLTTAAGITAGIPNTRVLLTNGAQACNVFWQVGSSATIGTFTRFVGSILSLQSITVNTSATIDGGRALARNGAVTLDTNTIKKADCATPVTPVTPVTPQGPAAEPTPAPAATSPPPPAAVVPAPLSIAPPLLTPVPSPQALANSVRLRGPTSPVSGPFTLTVTGTSIQSVTFYVDGKRRGTVRARPGRTKFQWRVDPRTQSRRVHRVTVRVSLPGRGQTTRRLRYRPRSPLPLAPRFAG
jgi:hypothetical protein